VEARQKLESQQQENTTVKKVWKQEMETGLGTESFLSRNSISSTTMRTSISRLAQCY
jgi:hypothetical protein